MPLKNKHWPDPEDEHDKKLLADVKEYGWHVLGIQEDAEGPAFAYSIGLHHTFEHPEVIIFGLDVKVMHKIINGIGEQIRSGEHFEHLHESSDTLEDYTVFFRSFDKKHYREYLGYARWFYQGNNFPALQCVWPDAAHRYPWHPDFNQNLVGRQPIFCEDNSWPFHDGKNRAAFTTKPVLQDGLPILLVSHDKEGDWQFLCGTTNRAEDGQVVCLGDLLQRDATIGELADLPEGWQASRANAGAAWTRVKARR